MLSGDLFTIILQAACFRVYFLIQGAKGWDSFALLLNGGNELLCVSWPQMSYVDIGVFA